ncbi:MAG: AmmeMemoRadiSam system protein B [Elusimicrobia bacterium]|nr:AmmeMemoRadiSam system protein B [Elusimicrobiota bacterium]
MNRCAALLFSALLSPCLASAAKRPPAVAGGFYPGDAAELAKMVEGLLAATQAPKLGAPVIALLVPHAGYAFSAPVQAVGYKAASDSYDVVAVFGAAHALRVPAAALYDIETFQTPLGDVPVDRNLTARLLQDKALFQDLPQAHAREHSVEVQLPFLIKRLRPGFKLLPILMNNDDPEVCARVGKAVAGALKGKKALIVVSSDLSHFPAGPLASKVDRATLLALERLDPDFFRRTSRILMGRGEKGLECTYCGEAGLLAAMSAARALGADRGSLLLYTNSAQTPLGESSRAVGYAAMAFIKSGKPPASEILLSPAQKKRLLKEARDVISLALEGKDIEQALDADPALNLPSAAFVTLTEDGRLRGCIGTTEAQMTLKDSVAYGAYSAAFKDTRFRPVTKEELAKIHIEISMLSPSRPVKSHERIVPVKNGVILSQGARSGLFLPQVWEQLPKKEDFLAELCSQKAGLPTDCWKDPKTEFRVFTVAAFEEGQ